MNPQRFRPWPSARLVRLQPRVLDLPQWVVRHTVVRAQRPGLGGRWSVRWQRRYLDCAAAGLPTPPGTTVRRTELAGCPAERVTVGATERPRAVLYLHGGAYTVGSARTHRSLAAFLAQYAGAVVFTLDYPLAPEHPYPAAVEATVRAYRQLLADGWQPRQLVIAGDSAGGGLAIAATRRVVDADPAQTPAGLALISPAVDIREWELLPGRRAARLDPVVRLRWAATSRMAYVGPTGDDADPGITPVAGPLAGLPPTMVHVDRDELLRDRIMAFVAKAHAEGVQLTVHEYAGSWHVFHAHAGLYRPAREALRELGQFVRART